MAPQLRSTLDELFVLADDLNAALSAVLDQSGIREERNTPRSNAIFAGHPWFWEPLDRGHQPLIQTAQRLLDLWEALAGRAVESAAPSRVERFREHGELMREIVEQAPESKASSGEVVGVRNGLAMARQAQLDMLADLPSAHGPGQVLVVPDTNAVIYQPAIEDWQPHDGDWTAVIVPQVIRELDQIKQREGDLGRAANSFIGRLKDYGRRGDTFAGVPLRDGAQLREVAVDADMANAPPWLRAGHGDDELLASVLELKWQNLTAAVVLITRDRNLQNKARLARVAYMDVEEIASPRATRPEAAKRPDEKHEAAARERLAGALPWARSKLEVPPASRATNPNKQAWTVQATPIEVGPEFADRVLGPDAPAWFEERASELFPEPSPLPQRQPSEETAPRGFAVLKKFMPPRKGHVLLVVDAGGIVGVRQFIEADPSAPRALVLSAVEQEQFQPLVQTCVDALEYLGSRRRALLEVWIAGVSSSQVLTTGHPTLRSEREGWLDAGLVHIGGEIEIPAGADDVGQLVSRWGRELARNAGIRARG